MLIEKARELGLMLSESPEFVRLSSARHAVDENTAVNGLLQEFLEKRERLVECISADDADQTEAVVLTDDMERLKSQLQDNPLMNEMQEAEEAFSELLSAINNEINACIGSGGCGGNCASCRGCAH